jgi:hypothetical protein
VHYEIKSSYVWYQEQAEGLGEDFLSELEQGYHAITELNDPLWVAVGMPVSRHPPHRSVREVLPHTAPISGNNAETSDLEKLRFSAYTVKPDRHSSPPLSADCGRNHGVSLGQGPSLHLLLRDFTLFVRRFLRYYVVVRLP